MSNDVHFMLYSGVLVATGILTLHFASRSPVTDRSHFGFVRGAGFVLAGLILILPAVIWVMSLLGQYPKAAAPVTPKSVFLLAGYLDVMFFWFIWRLNSYTFQVPGFYANPWDENWGASYSPELKRQLLDSVFERLDREGKIGNLVVDVGCGAAPVSKLLPATSERKFILIDVAGKNTTSPDSQMLRLDAEAVLRPTSLGYRKALVRICAFLERDPRAPARERHATALIFSDLLNYVDYRRVVSAFADFLTSEGRIIIVNHPSRGVRERFSKRGLKKNEDLYRVLKENRLEIESKEFPCRPGTETDESEEMIVLVAKKAG